jgi:membrane protein
VLRDPRRLDEVYATVLSALPSDMANLLAGVLNTMREQSAASVGVIALLLLLVNGSNFFTNMASVFDRVYAVEPRNFVVERLIGVAMLVVTAALLVTSTAAAGLVSIVNSLPGALPVGPAPGKVAGWSVSIVSVFLMFLVLYRVLPNKRHGWRQVVPGAFLSSALLLVISEVFPIYVWLFPPNQAYALFGVFLVFTFWLYLLGFVLVLGVELNAFLEPPSERPVTDRLTAHVRGVA